MAALLNAITNFSLLRGVHTPASVCHYAKGAGYTTLAVMDRNNLYGLPECIYEAEKEGLKLIVGATVSCEDMHIQIYASGNKGYAQLCRILTEKHCNEHFSLIESVQKCGDGLTVVCQNISLLLSFQGLIPVYYALNRPKLPPKKLKNKKIPCLITPPAVFFTAQDYRTHRLLRAIDLNTTDYRLNTSDCYEKDAYFLSWKELCSRFEVFRDALENTVRFGELMEPVSQSSQPVFPQLYGDTDPKERLRAKVMEGARWRYGHLSTAVQNRLHYELDIICSKGFASYFLIVDDIVKQSPRTCGRGSAAASIVSYCLGITNVDPIRYNLMFERFLNPGRMDPPDIDVDFAWDERDSVLDYVFAKYGNKHAAMVCTHNTFGPRMALRETARVFGLTESEISSVTDRMPGFFSAASEQKIADHLHNRLPGDRGEPELCAPWPEIIDHAQRIIGHPCSIGTHCGGIVITPDPIYYHTPIQISAKGYPIIQWEKDGCEEMGLVKIDLLGNRSLAVIRDSIKNLRREGAGFDEFQWDPASDPKTIDSLARGTTMGVFYVESPAMRLLQKRTGVGDFEHLVIHSSIIRPAANKYIREYIRRLKGGQYTAEHPLLLHVLRETYGIMVYQEDVARVAMTLAGFSAEEGDGLRKIMAKKKKRGKLEDYRQKFFRGALRNGVEQNAIEAIWRMVLSFAGYSFCKPHSASYVQVSFQSAYLKAHYPAAFMAAVISNFGGFYTTQAYIGEARRLGLVILPPDINSSEVACISAGTAIRIGLCLVRNTGTSVQEAVVTERTRNGPYRSLDDFLRRSGIAEKSAEAFVFAGTCDSVEPSLNRARIFWKLRAFYRSDTGSRGTPFLSAYSYRRLLAHQYKALGFLTEIHPIEIARPEDSYARLRIKDLHRYIEKTVHFYGWCVTTRTIATIRGEGMQFVSFEDETGMIEVVFFPQWYRIFSRYISSREAFLVRGAVVDDLGAITIEGTGLWPVKKRQEKISLPRYEVKKNLTIQAG